MKEKKVIYHSLIIFCAYCAYKLTGVYGTYAKDVWNYSLEEATYFAVFIQFLRPLQQFLLVGLLINLFLQN